VAGWLDVPARTACGGDRDPRSAPRPRLPGQEVAHLFHPTSRDAARDFVKVQVRRLLHGQIGTVIQSLHWLGTCHKLKGKRRDTLERICGYFHNNAHRRQLTTSISSMGSPSPPASSKGPAGVSSRTAWSAPQCAGSCPAPVPCWTCAVST